MKNKLILFDNIKGGVGKSTLCKAFAHYLVGRGEMVQILDADIQRTIVNWRKKDIQNRPDAKIPWDVVSVFDIDKKGDVSHRIQDIKREEGWILVDCPGNLEADRLEPIIDAADAIVVPLNYASEDIDAALDIFIPVIKQINNTAKIIFVPNRVNEKTQKDKEEVLRLRQMALDKLKRTGWVTPRIKDVVVFESHRLNTIDPMDRYQRLAVEHTFDSIFDNI